jgi:asparagine synthase (glutamine-hydrolysing)
LSVEPATYLVITPSATKVQRYWSLAEGRESSIRTIDEAAVQLEDLLRDSVALRMRSDVRIGTMLSGGLDSTSVISMVRRLMESSGADLAVTGEVLQAFTAIYRNNPIGEEHLVDELCNSLDVRANKVLPEQEDDLQPLLYKAAWHMEGPFFNSVPMVHTLLMRKARSVGVKVVLNGHGPDEMFAGYPASYIPQAIGDSIVRLRLGEALREINAMRDVHGLGRSRSLKLALATRTPRWVRDRRQRASLASSPLLREVSKKLLQRDAMAADGRFFEGGGLRSALRDDFFHQSLPNWLYLEDRISMSESIEARLPFLDTRLVEFAFSLPNQLKIGGGATKRVLREAMKNHLPKSIASNSRKIPFSGPDTSWIQGPLRPWVEQTFLKQDASIFEYLEPSATRTLIRSFLDPDSSTPRIHPYRIWKLVNTELWLQTYFNASRLAASTLI